MGINEKLILVKEKDGVYSVINEASIKLITFSMAEERDRSSRGESGDRPRTELTCFSLSSHPLRSMELEGRHVRTYDI